MATKRFTKSAIDWSKFAERVAPDQKPQFLILKTRSDNYLRRVFANPESAPKLDFSSYKSKISIAGLVDSFQKQYESVKIPYPEENITPKINEQEKIMMQKVQEFISESNKRITSYQVEISKWDKILPYEEMTMEDYRDAFPDTAFDPVNRPTFWPHTPDEQIGYKRPEIGSGGGH